MAKVIDAFMFFNELDILELRLNELDPVVDAFVIVESAEMHGSTNTKPFILQENWEKFAAFRHKIVYMRLPRLIPEYTDRASGWVRENFQRDSLLGPVRSIASPEDIVIVSDCDEIPRANTLREIRANGLSAIHKLELDFFYYNVNSYVGPWSHSTVGTCAQYDAAGGLQAPRGRLDMPTAVEYPVLPGAGWHFSYFGDIERLRLKIANFAHSSDPMIQAMLARDNSQVAADIAANKDIYRRQGMEQFSKRSSTDVRLPEYFLNNPVRFEKFTEEYFIKNNADLLGGR